MHEGYQTNVLKMDFSEAFDKVSHRHLDHLVAKLRSYGICGRTSEWIQCFLEGHTQSVVLDGEFSESVSVLSGVPQAQGPHPHILMTGGGGVRVNFLGLKFWPKVIFWVYERRRDFLGREKKRDFLGLRNKD